MLHTVSNLPSKCHHVYVGLVDEKSRLTAISSEGEEVLLQLMREKVKFLCGVYVKEVLRQLGRKRRGSLRDSADECTEFDI